jgi:hypothetical protein
MSEMLNIVEWCSANVVHDVLTFQSVKMLSRAEKNGCHAKDRSTMNRALQQMRKLRNDNLTRAPGIHQSGWVDAQPYRTRGNGQVPQFGCRPDNQRNV